jgi:broad specificity phosphatase PhoE
VTTTTTLIITRHGHVEGINPRRFRGREDVPLTDLGIAQAKETAARIAATRPPRAIYTSPMSRCVTTATAIGSACGIKAVVVDTLNDLDYGAWQWKTHEEMKKSSGELYAAWRTTPHRFRFPGGESLQDLVARTGEALRYALERHRGETVVLVGHDSVNRALLMQILDQPLSAYWRLIFEPCSISEVEFVDGAPWVLRINDTSHLAGLDNGFVRPTDAAEKVAS